VTCELSSLCSEYEFKGILVEGISSLVSEVLRGIGVIGWLGVTSRSLSDGVVILVLVVKVIFLRLSGVPLDLLVLGTAFGYLFA